MAAVQGSRTTTTDNATETVSGPVAFSDKVLVKESEYSIAIGNNMFWLWNHTQAWQQLYNKLVGRLTPTIPDPC